MGQRLRALLESVGILLVGPDETVIVFRMGRTDGDKVRNPGWHLILPILDRAVRVDRRERHLRIPAIEVIDADGNQRSLDLDVRWQVVDPLSSVVNLADSEGAVRTRTTVGLRKGAAELPTSGFDAARPVLAAQVRETLAADAKRWGLSINAVEIIG